jgi:proteasome lid subunit RPN8/RPN11
MLSISDKLLQEIMHHAEFHYPEEGAGLLLGQFRGDFRTAVQLLPLKNQVQASSRHNRYRIEPEDMIRAELKAEELGLDIIGVFHSHPNHPAVPSEFDRERALPWYSYVITQIDGTGALESRSWRLSDDRQFLEEEIFIQSSEVL